MGIDIELDLEGKNSYRKKHVCAPAPPFSRPSSPPRSSQTQPDARAKIRPEPCRTQLSDKPSPSPAHAAQRTQHQPAAPAPSEASTKLQGSSCTSSLTSADTNKHNPLLSQQPRGRTAHRPHTRTTNLHATTLFSPYRATHGTWRLTAATHALQPRHGSPLLSCTPTPIATTRTRPPRSSSYPSPAPVPTVTSLRRANTVTSPRRANTVTNSLHQYQQSPNVSTSPQQS